MFISARFARRVALLALLTTIAGCGSKVTPDNFAKIKQGQTQDEVTALLGKPTSTEAAPDLSATSSKQIWKDGDKTITVFIIDGKVAATDKSGF